MVNSTFQKTILPNGLRIVTEKIAGVYSIALGVWIELGSRDESEFNNGISHFIEHMLFKGTQNRTTMQIAESLESVGGNLDAFTAKEMTCYSAHLLHEHLPLAVDVLSDIIQHSLFEVREIEKEKEVIAQEICHYLDTPEDLVFEHFYSGFFTNHPLGYHIYGTIENVRKFIADDLRAFLNKNYCTNRIVIAAAGLVDHESLVDLVQRNFQNLTPGASRSISCVNAISKGLQKIQHRGTQTHLCLGMPAFPYRSEKRYPLLLLNTMLGGGMSSRLFQKIREEYGLAYSIFSFTDFYADTGVFGVYQETDRKNVDRSIDLIHKECNYFVTNSISHEEIVKAKHQVIGNLILGMENTFSRMNRLAKMEIYFNKYVPLEDVIQNIQAVSPEQIKQIAGELFQDNGEYLTVLYPRE